MKIFEDIVLQSVTAGRIAQQVRASIIDPKPHQMKTNGTSSLREVHGPAHDTRKPIPVVVWLVRSGLQIAPDLFAFISPPCMLQMDDGVFGSLLEIMIDTSRRSAPHCGFQKA